MYDDTHEADVISILNYRVQTLEVTIEKLHKLLQLKNLPKHEVPYVVYEVEPANHNLVYLAMIPQLPTLFAVCAHRETAIESVRKQTQQFLASRNLDNIDIPGGMSDNGE